MSLQVQGWNHGPEGGVPVVEVPGVRGWPRELLYSVPSTNFPTIRCVDVRRWYRLECLHGGVAWKPKRCRHCVGCLRWRRGKTIAQILSGLEGQSWTSLMTLTTRPGTTWPMVMKAFSRLVKRIRLNGSHVEYAAVKEEGPSTGMKHLHVILTGSTWVAYGWLTAQWKSLIGAWNVDVRRLNGTKVAAYVSGYLAKWVGPVRKVVTFSKNFRLPYAAPEGITVLSYNSPPEPRPFEAILEDGTIVERSCKECGIGGQRGEHLSGEGP